MSTRKVWDKSMPVRTRLRLVLKSTRSRGMKNKMLEAARIMQAKATASRDPRTRREAKKDADFFLKKYARLS